MQLAPFFPLLYRILQPTFPNCLWSGNPHTKAVALTFDDGPHPVYTPQLLKVLDYYSIPASFFWLGACVNRAPATAKTVSDRGHWIGLHGYDHRSFPLLSPPELKLSLESTQQAISQACGVHPTSVRDVRPPNGLFTPQTLDLLNQWQYRSVMWSVVPEDWVRPGIKLVVQRVLEQVQNGSTIVLHDGACGGQDVAQTAKILIPLLLQRGYEFVTIDALWYGHGQKISPI
ncbi:polysaccharide deacetylase family protein [Aliterella atlantica]|uniref:Chitooligosaccharide deacetylase NodB-like protein n=1 Tax=Aliterella atlantica CENA595 TaxID=1618023 RepID=A0A0D8ZR49_9CYAN|nr:chitooligosaccharide deacetylase NodB-like protein [Aliterella atlantica CENA595]